MHESFRFWGYGPETYRRVIGEDGLIRRPPLRKPTPVFGRVELHRDFIPRCGPLASECASGWLTWLMVSDDDPCAPQAEPVAWLTNKDGRRRSLITRGCGAAYQFHFDVDGSIVLLQNERYFSHLAPLYVRLGINPEFLPGWARKLGFNALNRVRRFRGVRGPLFPARPHDPSVDVWRYVIRSFVEEWTEAQPMPLWPDGKTYAVTLSHDVDTDHAFRVPRALEALRRIEEAAGVRSAWMVVTRYLDVGRDALGDLVRSGHEIGFHGPRHDHRLPFLSAESMADRLREGAERLRPFGAVGFRSPNYMRTDAMYRALSGRFEYDMSMHDAIGNASGLRRANEGCCTCLPFLVEGTDVLEIPTTLPEDWEFELRGFSPANALTHQINAVQRIKSLGGVANGLTHPEPNLSLRDPWLHLYHNFVDHVAADDDAWLALPRDVNRHWRERRQAIDALWRQDADHLRLSLASRELQSSRA